MRTTSVMLAIDDTVCRKAAAEFIEACPGLELVAQGDSCIDQIDTAIATAPDLVLVNWSFSQGIVTATTGVQVFARMVKQYCPQTKVALVVTGKNSDCQVSADIDGVISARELAVQLVLLVNDLFPSGGSPDGEPPTLPEWATTDARVASTTAASRTAAGAPSDSNIVAFLPARHRQAAAR